MYLMDKVRRLLYEVEEITFTCEDLKEITKITSDLKVRLDQPLKVAVVGVIKAGKSTLINALLQKEILATGNLETTYAVTWFRYGEVPKICVTLKNGTKTEGSIKDLYYWTVRDAKSSNPALDEVSYVEIYDNHPLLKELEIIDTPGLGSTHKIDSENTIDFLGLSSQITTREASKADAIIYAFSKGVGESDSDVLAAFQNSFSDSSPMNAFGVLTRVDANWSNFGDEDPFVRADKIALRYKTDPYLRTRLYNILPVSSKIAGCSNTLSNLEFENLCRLAVLPDEKLHKLFMNAEKFCFREYEDVNIPATDRHQLFLRFDRYGISTAIQLIRDGVQRDDLMEKIYQQSHVGDIRDLINQHFVKRAGVIRAHFILSKVKDACQSVINLNIENRQAYELAQYIMSLCQEIEENEQSFSELKILQYYYNEEFTFPTQEEEEDFLRLTGERGSALESRLGCGTLRLDEMMEIANQKAKYWYTQSNLKSSRGVYNDVAQMLGRICEHIRYYLKIAQI